MYGEARPEEQRAGVPEGRKGMLLLSTFPEWEREGVVELQYNKWGIRIGGTVFVFAVAWFSLALALFWDDGASFFFYVMMVSSIYCLAELRSTFRNRRRVLAVALFDNGLDMLHLGDRGGHPVISFMHYSDIRAIKRKGIRVWVHPREGLKARWISLEQIGLEGVDLLIERFGTASLSTGPPKLVVYRSAPSQHVGTETLVEPEISDNGNEGDEAGSQGTRVE